MAWMVMMAPTGTPEDSVRKVSADLRVNLTKPDVRGRLAKIGSYARPISPQETVEYIEAEQQTWGSILEDVAKLP